MKDSQAIRKTIEHLRETPQAIQVEWVDELEFEDENFNTFY